MSNFKREKSNFLDLRKYKLKYASIDSKVTFINKSVPENRKYKV